MPVFLNAGLLKNCFSARMCQTKSLAGMLLLFWHRTDEKVSMPCISLSHWDESRAGFELATTQCCLAQNQSVNMFACVGCCHQVIRARNE